MLALLAGLALADTGPARYGPPGHALNPERSRPGARVDELGYSLFASATFSPSGILYPPALAFDALTPADDAPATESGWIWRGVFEAGYLVNAGDADAADFTEFADFDPGPLLGRFAWVGVRPGTGERLSVTGSAPERDDGHARVEYRRPGAFEGGLAYNAIPHTFSSTARVLWDGAGSGMLTLPDGLTPGASTAEQVRAALGGIATRTLALQRRQGGIFGDFELAPRLTLSLNAGTEWRDGERPFGATFAYPTLGQVMETVEPIDYLTHEVDVALRARGRRFQVNLAYSASLFINRTDALVWENPGLSLFPPPFPIERGRTALAPDNRFHQIQADAAVNLPWMNARWTTTLAYNRKRNNDALLPPTISTGSGTINGTPVDLDLWNTVASLSERAADARIDTLLAQTRVSFQPARRLRTRLELRLLDESNDTRFTTFNPLTGEFGTIRIDGGIVFDDGIFQPGLPGELIRIDSLGHETDEFDASLEADWRLLPRTRLGAALALERRDYRRRRRGSTLDRRARLELSDRTGPWASARVSFEQARRSGEAYRSNVLAPFFSTRLDGFTPLFADGTRPLGLDDLRSFDLSSRDQWVVDGQIRFNPGARADLAISGRLDHQDHDAEFGRTQRRQRSANAELSYQLGEHGSAWVYLSFDDHELDAAGINDAGARSADGSAGGDTFPLDRAWLRDLDETNHAAGVGLTRQWGPVLLEADYTFTHARSRREFGFASGLALAGGADPASAGSALPVQRFERHLLRFEARVPVRPNLGLRLFYRFESERIDDPAFDALTEPLVDNQLFLLAGPEDFDAHLIGFMLEFSLGRPADPGPG